MKMFFGRGESLPVSRPTDVRDNLREDRRYQYQDGYSMAEAAKSWIAADDALPPTIASIVGSAELESAHFEFSTRVWGGGLAMTDVMAFLPNGVIAVEAKSEESFDDLVSVWINRNERSNPASPPHRRKVVERYADAFGVQFDDLLKMRYQLLQRTLCAALTAHDEKRSQSWMIVQSFAAADSEGHRRNRGDFDDFVQLAGNAPVIQSTRVQICWTDNAKSPSEPACRRNATV